MADVEERNHQALMTMLDGLKTDGFLVRPNYRLCTYKHDDKERPFDGRLVCYDVIVEVLCNDEGFDVEISPPHEVSFLFEDKYKPKLVKGNQEPERWRIEMRLSSDVNIQGWSNPPFDRVRLTINGDNDRLNVHLYGDTCVPRLKLLLERICRGR